jgi:hypothetical protein|tara:strand:+ start:331 stop:516 length:186 start_codon:yes stop_codon:yes gene_type:complete
MTVESKIYVDAITSDYIFEELSGLQNNPKEMLKEAQVMIENGMVAEQYTSKQIVKEFYNRL